MMKHLLRFTASILPLAAVTLIVLQLLVSNALAGEGKSAQSMDQTIEDIRGENQRLRQQLATQTSLLAIEEKAKELGFRYVASTVTLLPADVAYKPR